MDKIFFNILATFAEFEVDLLRIRTREGIAIAKAQAGVQAVQTVRLASHLLELHEAGARTVVELAEPFNVSRSAGYRVLERANAAT